MGFNEERNGPTRGHRRKALMTTVSKGYSDPDVDVRHAVTAERH